MSEAKIIEHGDVLVHLNPIDDTGDCRVVVSKEGHGQTTVNYTPEGVIADIYNEGGELVDTMAKDNDVLITVEDKVEGDLDVDG